MRSSRSLLPAALLIPLAALAVALFFLLQDGERERAPSVALPGSAPAASGTPNRTAQLDGMSPIQPEARAAAPLDETTADPQRARQSTPSVDPDTARWIRGTVFLPPGVVRDETLEVVALLVPPPPRKRPNGIALFLGRGVLERWLEERTPLEVARVQVKPGGSYELPLSPELERVWIDVDGRFVRLTSPLPVELAPEPVRADLQPLAAACIRGQLEAPEDATGSERRFDDGLAWVFPEMGGFGDFDIFENLQRHLLRAEIDLQGRFELRGLVPDRSYVVVVDPPALSRAQEEDIKLAPGELRELTLRPKRGGVVRGRVVDEHGAPVSGAEVTSSEVEASLFEGERPGFASIFAKKALSAGDGRFELTGLRAGETMLKAEKAGYKRAGRTKVSIEDAEMVTAVEIRVPRGRAIVGQVRWPDGAPAAGALVSAGKGSQTSMQLTFEELTAGAGARDREVRAGPDGSFVLGGLGLGRWSVLAQHSSKRSNGRWEDAAARVEDIKSGGDPVELVLAPVRSLRGWVRDPDGKPLDHFEVRVVRRDADENPLSIFTGAATGRLFEGREGAFRLLGLDDGAWQLRAEAEGFGISAPVSVELPAALSEPAIEITMQLAASIRGQVLDPDGLPFPGAKIQEDGSMLRGMTSFFTTGTTGLSTISNPQGEFLMDGLNPGTLQLTAEAEGYTRTPATEVSIAPGETYSGLVLRLGRGGSIDGQVLDGNGSGRADVRVRAWRGSYDDSREQRTDAAGGFSFSGLEQDSWTVRADGEREEESEDEWRTPRITKVVEVIEGETTNVVLSSEEKEPVLIKGRVTAGGEPVEVSLHFTPDDSASRWDNRKSTRSQADGAFELSLPGAGGYQLSIGGERNARSMDERWVSIPAVSEHLLEIELASGIIAGRVVDRRGQPLEDVEVRLLPAGEGTRRRSFEGESTDDNGSFRFNHVPPGIWALRAGQPAWGARFDASRRKHGSTLQSDIHLESGAVLDGLVLVLDEPGAVSGEVVDTSGLPVKEAAIFARSQDGTLVDSFSMVSSDSTGSFRYSGLGPGRYTISARTRSRASVESAEVIVRSGEDSGPVRLVVEAGAVLSVRTLDEAGDPVSSTVAVRDSSGRRVDGMAGMDSMAGFFSGAGGARSLHEVRPLAPGTYRVQASGAGGSSAAGEVYLSEDEERELVLVLPDPEQDG